ncbi:hypothetical protein D9V34_16320 [Mycetocola lacteus]|uniref:Uncharacterized protein n=1 Tax=Mycetocola lacteus TaxID=76637 RepID=A0A3L7AFY7_9MICO|nr:hypothetical protein D9V34_16320 [Mycetocola lacteus]
MERASSKDEALSFNTGSFNTGSFNTGSFNTGRMLPGEEPGSPTRYA